MSADENRRIVLDCYQPAFNDNQAERAAAAHLGATYTQHNPEASDGQEAFIGYVGWLRGQFAPLRLDIKRIMAEADLGVTHSNLHLEPGDRAWPSPTSGAWPTARSSSTGTSSSRCPRRAQLRLLIERLDRAPCSRPVVSGAVLWWEFKGSHEGQTTKGSSAEALEPLIYRTYVVAGAGFEPATSGL